VNKRDTPITGAGLNQFAQTPDLRHERCVWERVCLVVTQLPTTFRFFPTTSSLLSVNYLIMTDIDLEDITVER
jgi:hypothetical protein